MVYVPWSLNQNDLKEQNCQECSNLTKNDENVFVATIHGNLKLLCGKKINNAVCQTKVFIEQKRVCEKQHVLLYVVEDKYT